MGKYEATVLYNHVFFSKNSFASLTLVARYGLPPRSGWLSNIRVRWALRTLSFVRLLSLCFVKTWSVTFPSFDLTPRSTPPPFLKNR